MDKHTVDQRQTSSKENVTNDPDSDSIQMKTTCEKKGTINLTAKRSPWSSLIITNVKEEGFKQDRDNQRKSGHVYEKLHLPFIPSKEKVESGEDEDGQIDACHNQHHPSPDIDDLDYTISSFHISCQPLTENLINQKPEVPPEHNERPPSPSGALEQGMQFSLSDVKAEETKIEVPQPSTGTSSQTMTVPETQEIIGGYSPNMTIPQTNIDTHLPNMEMPQPVRGVSLKNVNISDMTSVEVNSPFIPGQVNSSVAPWHGNAHVMPGQVNSSGGTTRSMVPPGYTGSYPYYPLQTMPFIPPGGYPMNYGPYPVGPYGTTHPPPSPTVQHTATASSQPTHRAPLQASLMYMRSPIHYQPPQGGFIGHVGSRDTAGQKLAVPGTGPVEVDGGYVNMTGRTQNHQMVERLPSKDDIESFSPVDSKGYARIKGTNDNSATEEVENKGLRREKDDESPRMIRVKGLTRSVSHDALEMFFENKKRCGGGEIESIKWGRSKREAFITFKDPSVVLSVLEKQRRERFYLEKMELAVEEYIPSPQDPLRLFLANLSPRVTHECLLLYLEPRCNSTPTEVLYRKSSGTALVTFSEPPDIDLLLRRVKEKPLEGNYIQVKRVPVTRCVQLMGLLPTTTKDTVELYFENAKRSGGGPVEDVIFGRDKQSCVVFFENAKDAERVCMRPHIIEKKDIQVCLYYECWDDDFDADESSVLTYRTEDTVGQLKLPDPVELKDLNPQILWFLMKNEKQRQALERNLLDVNGLAKWPSCAEDYLIIECTVKVEDKSTSSVIKDWSTRVVDKVKSFAAGIEVVEFNLIQMAWPRVLEGLQKTDLDNPDDVGVFVEHEKYIITVAGPKVTVEKLRKTIQDMIAIVESEIELEKKRVRETKELKTYEITLLRASHFKQDIEKMCPGLQFDLDRNQRIAIFVGQANVVQRAVILMYEKLHSFVNSSMPVSKAAKNLLLVKETCKYIKQKMVSQKIIGIWDAVRHEHEAVTLFGRDESEVRKAIQVIKDCLIEKEIPLYDAMVHTVQGQECSQFLQNILDKHIGKVAIETSMTSIMVVAVDDIFQSVLAEIKHYLDKHSIQDIFLKLDLVMVKFIQRYKKEDIKTLEKRFESSHVKLSIIEYEVQKGIKINGTKDGCKAVKIALAEMAKNVIIKEHVIVNKVGLKEFLQGSKGREGLSSIEFRCQCFIEMKDSSTPSSQQLEGASGGYGSGSEDDAEQSYDPTDWQPSSDSGGASVYVGEIKVSVLQGELAKQRVDVIVNSTSQKLNLNMGHISKTILKYGGDNIQKECLQQYPNGINPGQVVVTSGGNLSCTNVYHGCLSAYDGGQGNSMELMKTFVLNCLTQADKSGFKSIAFPALGTGNLKFPADGVGKLMVQCIHTFGKTRPNTSLKDITLVVYSSDLNIFQAFIAVLGGTTVPSASTCKSAPSSSNISRVSKSPVVGKLLKARNKPSSLVFSITMDSELNFQAAVKDLEGFIKNEFIEKEITSPQEIISKLLDRQVTKMEGMMQGNAMVLVNRKKGVIQVSGDCREVFDTYDTIMKYLHNIERDKMKKEQEKLKAQQAMSDLSLPSIWTKMAPNENMKCVTLNPNDMEYKDVARKFLASAGSAGQQNAMNAYGMNNGLHQLQRSLVNMRSPRLTVIKIERVQNKTLYQQYKAKKRHMEQQNSGGANKKELWHGTASTNIENINNNGFNMSYGGSDSNTGTYFTIHASCSVNGYSHHGGIHQRLVSGYCSFDENRYRHIYLANVLAGDSVVANMRTHVCPVKKPVYQVIGGASGIACETVEEYGAITDYNTSTDYYSTTDNMTNPQIFVIFHNMQAYPLYHITFH